jgi:SPP1 family predicted phage head-tail adaptor
MRAGKIDRLVVLQTKSVTRNAVNEEVVDWNTLATVWAERRDLRGREYFQAQQVNAEISAVFRIRYRTDVTATMRLVESGKAYELVAPPVEIGRREGLDLMCAARN